MVEWNDDVKDKFWWFVHERHEIFIRRFIENRPPPWTQDKVLQKHYFTNVYRELDRGTLFLTEITKGHKSVSTFASVLVYRVMNNMEAFKSLVAHLESKGVGFQDADSMDHIMAWVQKRLDMGKGVFTAAHLPPAVKWSPAVHKNKTTGIFDITVRCIIRDARDMYYQMSLCPDLQSVHKLFKQIPGIGAFYAYEFATDMAHLGFVQYSLDSWANIGPGCDRGLGQMVRKGDKYEALLWLSDHQEAEFYRLGLAFRYHEGKRLSLRNIEHSICEFSKYLRAEKTDWSRRQFEPKEIPLPSTAGVIREL